MVRECCEQKLWVHFGSNQEIRRGIHPPGHTQLCHESRDFFRVLAVDNLERGTLTPCSPPRRPPLGRRADIFGGF